VDETTVDPSGVTQAHEVERLLEEWVGTLSEREKEVLEGRLACMTASPKRWMCSARVWV